jgi:hypothetical protein
MPRNPRRRQSRTPRRLPPRPTYDRAPAPDADATRPATRDSSPSLARRASTRDGGYLASELRRVAGVSAACLGLLALLVVVDRLG